MAFIHSSFILWLVPKLQSSISELHLLQQPASDNMFQFFFWHRLLADIKTLYLLHLETDGQTAFIFHWHHWFDVDLFWKSKESWAPERRNNFADALTTERSTCIQSEGRGGRKGGQAVYVQSPHKSERAVHTGTLQKPFHPGQVCWANMLALSSALLCIAHIHEQLKSFISLCPN